jgi:hypothetical protein
MALWQQPSRQLAAAQAVGARSYCARRGALSYARCFRLHASKWIARQRQAWWELLRRPARKAAGRRRRVRRPCRRRPFIAHCVARRPRPEACSAARIAASSRAP